MVRQPSTGCQKEDGAELKTCPCVCVRVRIVKMSVAILRNTGGVTAHFGFGRGLEFCLGHFGPRRGSLQQQSRYVGKQCRISDEFLKSKWCEGASSIAL